MTATFAWVQFPASAHRRIRTEEAWYRNFATAGTDQFGRTIIDAEPAPMGAELLDPTLASRTNLRQLFAHGNYESAVSQFHQAILATISRCSRTTSGRRTRTTEPASAIQTPISASRIHSTSDSTTAATVWTSGTSSSWAGVYEFPMGFAASATVIAHTGVPFPLYINMDINGDGVANSGFSHQQRSPEHHATQREWEYSLAVILTISPDLRSGTRVSRRIIKMSDRYHVLLSG